MNEIIILVSSLHFLKKKNIPFIFSDRHAYLKTALFSEDLADLNRIIWTTLQEKNFRKDDLERFEKYQAEALLYKHVPLTAILGAVCYDAVATSALKADIKAMGLSLNVIAQPKWYL
jgi:ssDNA thymidine ADP-ribosyltransferase, DarT